MIRWHRASGGSCIPEDYKRWVPNVTSGDLDRIRLVGINTADIVYPNVSMRFDLPPGVELVEGNTTYKGPLPPGNTALEAVVRFTEPNESVRIQTFASFHRGWRSALLYEVR